MSAQPRTAVVRSVSSWFRSRARHREQLTDDLPETPFGVPPPPTATIVAEGRWHHKVRRARGFVALVACVAVLTGGLVGVTRQVADDTRRTPSGPASSVPPPSATAGAGPLDVSGSGVGAQPFGTDAGEVTAAVSGRLGEPDLTLGPQRYFRVAGSDAWFEAADDPMSPSWQYPVTSVTCWGVLCLIFGGDEADALQLRGWELAQQRRWSEYEELKDVHVPEVRLADTGIELGDSWKRLHAAYPDTVVGGAEGATVAVQNTPWSGVSDGVAGWRLSGQWDFSYPSRAPAGAVVTRLSGGQGPQLGCC